MFWFIDLFVYFVVRFVVFGVLSVWFFCYLCLLVSVNSVVHWLVMDCMYDLVASFFVLWLDC